LDVCGVDAAWVSSIWSIWKTSVSGESLLALGALISTCSPSRLKPAGGAVLVAPSAIVTAPPAVPAGTVTEVAAPPGGGLSAVLTVVDVPRDADPAAVAAGGLPSFGVTAAEGSDVRAKPLPAGVVAATVNV
jgi:hypothetical protein